MHVCCVTDYVYYKSCNYMIIILTIMEVCRVLILEMSPVKVLLHVITCILMLICHYCHI